MFFTFGFQFTYVTFYFSMGKVLAGEILNIGRQGLFLILVVIIFTKLLASNGVIYAQPVADIISTLITIPLAIKFKNDLKIKGNYSAMKPVEDQKVIQQR